MEGGLSEIRIHFADPGINALLRSIPESSPGGYSTHYNQSEDSFILLAEPYTVPSLPIHHDVRVPQPDASYRSTLMKVIEGLAARVPDLFHGLSYFFDPGDIFRPTFFQLYTVGEMRYLYLLRLDLGFHTHDHEIIEKGSNDQTAAYASRKLFVEGLLVPIERIAREGERVAAFVVDQTISSTWIGEAGRGYLIQGIWMDSDLTKFFSKLLLPKGVRAYPYYPFVCRYRTVCHTVVRLSAAGRREHLPYLHRAYQFLKPEMRNIESALRGAEFSEGLSSFQAIKQRVPDYWKEMWTTLKVTPYLNENDMKEFTVEF